MEESILNIDFVNQDVNGNAMGLPEPIVIAKSEDGEAVYFNCVLHTYNAKDGYRLLYYSLYTLKN